MKNRSPLLGILAVLVSTLMVIPPEAAGQAAQRAGQVSRAIPQVAIARGSQNLTAALKTVVDWGDLVHTGEGGRARVSLDDGSLINVGSSSSFAIKEHNAATQQTQIELTYGRMRSQVVKQTKPNAKFEVHTPVGVAGVVGTDFFLSYLNGLFQVIVYEGHIRFCNLDGQCVDVLAGQTSTIRDGHMAPDPPSQATPAELTDAANATSVGFAGGAPPPHHLSPWLVVGLTMAVAVPAIVIPLVTRNSNNSSQIRLQQGCSTNPSSFGC
jgi:hypothetical protein